MSSWHSLHRIGVRLALFLTVALLPLGLIAVWQTRQVSEEIDQRSRLTLTALTQQAAQAERRIIERSFGAAGVLAIAAQNNLGDPQACSQLFSNYLAATPEHSFAGFATRDMQMTCSSEDGAFDMADSEVVQQAVDDPQPRVSVRLNARFSQQPVIIVSYPVYQRDEFIGTVFVSTPRRVLEFNFDPIPKAGPISVVTFNIEGEIIGSNGDYERAINGLPENRNLGEFVGAGVQTFSALGRDGVQRTFAVVPIVRNVAYAIGTWQNGQDVAAVERAFPAFVFPIIMWLTSLAVAYFAVHRVVIKHIRKLQREMRAFALHRQLPVSEDHENLPTEIAEMHRTFVRTAGILLRDEADLENALHEQKVLLKEVHHRVKNNLQLISSIMSMQSRKVSSEETRTVLRRLQDRVLGLATIHRNLYQSESLSRVRADVMIKEVFDQLCRSALPAGTRVDMNYDLDEVVLYPDQIVPLTLLASEAATNALKNLGSPENGSARLDVALRQMDTETVVLSIENTLGRPVIETPVQGALSTGDGLGSRLIAAFAGQLSADLEQIEGEESYVIRASFATKPFAEDGSVSQAA